VVWEVVLGVSVKADAIRYSIGNPTNAEQVHLEHINRLRADPGAEGARLASTLDPDIIQSYSHFRVDLATMRNSLEGVTATGPLAPSNSLLEAARVHSHDMLDHGFQAHAGTDGSNAETRIRDKGYKPQMWAENIFGFFREFSG
jgi:RecA/RadA recombinase